jgi:hypothetical protein
MKARNAAEDMVAGGRPGSSRPQWPGKEEETPACKEKMIVREAEEPTQIAA